MADQEFQSTLSVRRATLWIGSCRGAESFQSTLSVRRATRHTALPRQLRRISIHTLRKESDSTTPSAASNAMNFNPRSP